MPIKPKRKKSANRRLRATVANDKAQLHVFESATEFSISDILDHSNDLEYQEWKQANVNNFNSWEASIWLKGY